MLIILFLISHVFLQIFEEYFKNNITNQKKIFLTELETSTPLGTISIIFEYVILGRYSFFGYKNYIKNNLRIFSALNTTLVVFFAFDAVIFLFDINFDKNDKQNVNTLYLSFFTLFVSIFALERSLLHKKWEYLANLYNKRNELDFGLKRDIMEVSLALDIIEMEMWSHNSYNSIFEKVLKKSLLKSTKNIEKNALVLEKKIAYEIVQDYQEGLLNKQKEHFQLQNFNTSFEIKNAS